MILAAAILFVLALFAFIVGEMTWNLRWWSVSLVLAVAGMAVVFIGAVIQIFSR